jgi:hypothetical protein
MSGKSSKGSNPIVNHKGNGSSRVRPAPAEPDTSQGRFANAGRLSSARRKPFNERFPHFASLLQMR